MEDTQSDFATLSTVELSPPPQQQFDLPGTSASFERIQEYSEPSSSTVVIVTRDAVVDDTVNNDGDDEKTVLETDVGPSSSSNSTPVAAAPREKRKYTKKTPSEGGDEITANESKIKCTVCSFSSPHAGHMRRHMEKKHLNTKPRVVTEHKCEHCDKTFKDLFHLNNHRNLHLGAKPFVCTQCDSSFGSKGELDRHSKYKHTMERPHQCPDCEYATVELSKLKRHMRVHTDERPYLCGFCDYASRDTFRLKRHMRTHTGEKPYECPHCDMSFAQSNTLKTHVRTKHEQKMGTEEDENETEGKERAARKSGKRPRKRAKLSQALVKSEESNSSREEAGGGDNDETSSKKRAKRTSRTDSTEQGATTTPLSSLNTNQEATTTVASVMADIVKDDEGWFVCNHCAMRFVTSDLLFEHIVKHTGDRPFECDKCNMKFSHQFALRAHKQSHDAEHSKRVRQSLREASNAVKKSKNNGATPANTTTTEPTTPTDDNESLNNTSANAENQQDEKVNLQSVELARGGSSSTSTCNSAALAITKPPSEYQLDLKAEIVEEKITIADATSCDDQMSEDKEVEFIVNDDEQEVKKEGVVEDIEEPECSSRPISPIAPHTSLLLDSSDIVLNETFDLETVEGVKQLLQDLVVKVETELMKEKEAAAAAARAAAIKEKELAATRQKVLSLITTIEDDDITIIDEKKPDCVASSRQQTLRPRRIRAQPPPLQPQPKPIETFRISQPHTSAAPTPAQLTTMRGANPSVITATPIMATPIMNHRSHMASSGTGIYVLPAGVNHTTSVTPVTPITPITPIGSTSCMPLLGGNQFAATTSCIPIGRPINVPIGAANSITASPYHHHFGQMPTVIPLGPTTASTMAMPIMSNHLHGGNRSNQVTVIPLPMSHNTQSHHHPLVTAIAAQPLKNIPQWPAPTTKPQQQPQPPKQNRVLANLRPNNLIENNEVIVLDGPWTPAAKTSNTESQKRASSADTAKNVKMQGSYPILASQIKTITSESADKSSLLHQLPFNDTRRAETSSVTPVLIQKAAVLTPTVSAATPTVVAVPIVAVKASESVIQPIVASPLVSTLTHDLKSEQVQPVAQVVDQQMKKKEIECIEVEDVKPDRQEDKPIVVEVLKPSSSITEHEITTASKQVAAEGNKTNVAVANETPESIDQDVKSALERMIEEEEQENLTRHSSLISDDLDDEADVSNRSLSFMSELKDDIKAMAVKPGVERRRALEIFDDSMRSVLSTSVDGEQNVSTSEEEKPVVLAAKMMSKPTKSPGGLKRSASSLSSSPSPSKSSTPRKKSNVAVKVTKVSSSKQLHYDVLYGSSAQDRSINKTIEQMKKNNAERADAAATAAANSPASSPEKQVEQMTFKKGMRKRLIQHTENSFVIMDKNDEVFKRMRKSTSIGAELGVEANNVKTTSVENTDESMVKEDEENNDKSIEEIVKKDVVEEEEEEEEESGGTKRETRRGPQLGRFKRTDDELPSDGVCKICARPFNNTMRLDRHMREMHRMVPRNRKAYNTFYSGESFLSVLDATATTSLSPEKKKTETLAASEVVRLANATATAQDQQPSTDDKELVDGDCLPYFDINCDYPQTQLALSSVINNKPKPAAVKEKSSKATSASKTAAKGSSPGGGRQPAKTALEKRSSHLAYETQTAAAASHVEVIELSPKKSPPAVSKANNSKKSTTSNNKTTKSPSVGFAQYGSLDRFVKRK